MTDEQTRTKLMWKDTCYCPEAPKYYEKNLSEAHFFHQKSHRDWYGFQGGTSRGVAGRLTVWAVARPHFSYVQTDSNGRCVSDAAGNFLAAMLSGLRTVGGPTGFAINVSIPNLLQDSVEIWHLIYRLWYRRPNQSVTVLHYLNLGTHEWEDKYI